MTATQDRATTAGRRGRSLGAYAAKRCPVRAQQDVLQPGEPLPPSPFALSIIERGNEHEEAVTERLRAAGAVVVGDGGPDDLVGATLAAMGDGAEVVVDGRLPEDRDGARLGEPDVLVRVGDGPVDGRWRYVPVEVKSHAVLDERGEAGIVGVLEQLTVPADAAVPTGGARTDGTVRDDLVQLAHYQRMLEAIGHATAGAAWGAVIGREGVPVWLRLDEERWSSDLADEDEAPGRRSALALYDVEFAHRLAVTRAAEAHRDDAGADVELLEPAKRTECDRCPWWGVCGDWLEERSDPSLLPKVSPSRRDELRTLGIHTIADVAQRGAEHGLAPELVLQARARLADRPIPRPDADLTVPRAEVEVDVDMENTEDGAYLWGAWVTCRGAATGLVEEGYRSFVVWDDALDDGGAGAAFEEFWTWLMGVVRTANDGGVRFHAYCWSAQAENRYLRAGAEIVGREREVEAFIDSPLWLDLLAWFRSAYATGRGNGLKTVATMLDFAWRDDDPSGAESMLWYAQATDPTSTDAERAAARERLLAYNEDDVRATLHVREALDG